jgi:hypothetical protein
VGATHRGFVSVKHYNNHFVQTQLVLGANGRRRRSLRPLQRDETVIERASCCFRCDRELRQHHVDDCPSNPPPCHARGGET